MQSFALPAGWGDRVELQNRDIRKNISGFQCVVNKQPQAINLANQSIRN
jgi:hypothetical protein